MTNADAPVATTTGGAVRGTREGDLAVFRGIPYAAPPVGPLRFRPPQSHEGWHGVREALAFGPAAAQNASMLETMLGSEGTVNGEDCLTLNIWTPDRGAGDATPSDLPVMVWIHGGAFVTGTGATPWYDGTRLAGRGAAVVTLNYRRGALGFLHLAGLAEAPGSGNCGILDQVAALAWVRDNITAFGGDPGNVTVFGESAGAMSVGTLLGLPGAAGLFHKAILQSGACAHVHDSDSAEGVTRQFLDELEVTPADLSPLWELPTGDLLAAQQRVGQLWPFSAGLPFQPVIDGVTLPGHPSVRVAAVAAAHVALLLGTTSEEMKLFLLMDPSIGQLDEDGLTTRTNRLFAAAGHPEGHVAEVYRERLGEAGAGEVWNAISTDQTFRIPALRLAERQRAHQRDVYVYLFTFASPAFDGAFGACHALEIPFVWDNLDAPGAAMFTGPATPAMEGLATAMADAWVAFARTGTPGA
ncbi:carboxylesterase/lipase family protein [soil metagenome]